MQTASELVGHKRAHKFGAKVCYCKLGHRHPSKAEAMHCWCLQCEIKTGTIRDLEYEKSYNLIVAGKLVGKHKPDFTYKRRIIVKTPTGPNSYTQIMGPFEIICVDEVKGVRTSDWVFRSKIFQVLYPEIEYRVIQ